MDLAPTAALGLLSPQLAEAFEPNHIARILTGTPGSAERLDDRQTELVLDHRVLGLVPRDWEFGPSYDRVHLDRYAAMAQLGLVQCLQRAADALGEAGIDHRVLKGMATDQLDYSGGRFRQSGDVDLLVRPEDFVRAVDALRTIATPRESVDAGLRIGKGVFMTDGDGFEVDVHHRLNWIGDGRPELLFSDPVELPETGGLAMSPALRMVHAASHVALSAPGHRRLSGLADIAALHTRDDLDLADIRAAARALGVEWAVAWALALESTLTDRGLELDDWAQPDRLARLAYARADRSMWFEHLLKARAQSGITNRVRYLRHFVAPPAEDAAQRGGRLQFYRRAFTQRRSEER